MAENEGLRVTGEAIVMSLVPDFCKTPPSMVPVPYQIIGRFSDGVRFADTVSMTAMNVMTMDSRLTTVYGDEAGTGGGIFSGVHKGWCRPITHSPTVRAKGHPITFHTSLYWMNCDGPDGPGNTIGIATFVENVNQIYIGPLCQIIGDTNPMVEPETPEEKEWWEAAWSGITDAADFAWDGAVNAVDTAKRWGVQAIDATTQIALDAWSTASGYAHQAWDAIVDAQAKYKLLERGLAVVGIVDGAKNIVAGYLASSTLIGAVVGVPVAAYGVDTVVANANQLWTGEFQPTYTEQVFGPEVDFAASLITPTQFGKKLLKEGLEHAAKEAPEKLLKESGDDLLESGLQKTSKETADSALDNGAKVTKTTGKVGVWPTPKAKKLLDELEALKKEGPGKNTQRMRELSEELGNEAARQHLRNKLGREIADADFYEFGGKNTVNLAYKDPATGKVYILEAKGGMSNPKMGTRVGTSKKYEGQELTQGSPEYLEDVAESMAKSSNGEKNEAAQMILDAIAKKDYEYIGVWGKYGSDAASAPVPKEIFSVGH